MHSPARNRRKKGSALAEPYAKALCRYLKQGTSSSLRPALKLGHQAVALGVETLDLALIHEHALIDQLLSVSASAARERVIKRAGTFFTEAIIPLESTHRAAVEANRHLHKLNQTLSQRTLDLAASNRQLKKEIARRRVVEKTLLKSEQRSSRLLEQSRLMQGQLRRLSRRVLSVQEEERKRISRELHDVIAQMLTGINVQLATLKTDAAANTKGISRKIAHTQRLVEKSVDSVHRFARELRPAVLDDLGLIPALHSFMKSFSKKTGVHVSLTAFAELETLSSAKRTVLYRIAQEALTNVARHAQASRVDVSILKHDKAVHMRINDDGIAFDVERAWQDRKSQHLGLLGMRERVEMVGGTFAIHSEPDHGTRIHAQIPFANSVKEPSKP
jgi:signal transduction histidine kinase